MKETVFGIIAGVISSLGMGGGTILILLLNIFLDIEQHVCQATNLIFFIPTSITAITINAKNKQINWKKSKNIIIFGIIGAILGSMISSQINNRELKKIFGIFIGLIAIFQTYEIYTSHRKRKIEDTKNK